MTHRTVEGSPESGSRITPNAPASPAPPQGEREALAESFYRHIAYGDDEHRAWLRRETYAWFARASLRASPAVPVAQDEREATVEIHIPQYIDLAKSDKLVDAVCRAITKHDIEFTRVKLVHPNRAALSAATPPAAVPQGWKIEHRDSKPFKLINITAPNGYSSTVGSHERNPMNVLYMLADALLAAAPQTAGTQSDTERDAARYRWLREQDWFSGPLAVLREPKRVLTQGIGLGADCPSHHRLDAAIDAAMGTPPADNKENGND